MIWSLTRAMMSSTVTPPYALAGAAVRDCAMAEVASSIVLSTDTAEMRRDLRVISWQLQGTSELHLGYRRHCKWRGSGKDRDQGIGNRDQEDPGLPGKGGRVVSELSDCQYRL